MFFECNHVYELLSNFEIWINTNSEHPINLNKTEYLLGVIGKENKALNTLYLLTKAYIYESKLKGERLNLELMKKQILLYVKTEKYIHRKNDTLDLFLVKWNNFSFLTDATGQN